MAYNSQLDSQLSKCMQMLKSGVILEETSLVTPQVSFRPPNLVGEVRGRSRTGRLWRSR